jgi:hypothetical protein
VERGDLERFRRKHALYCRDLAERGAVELWGPDEQIWLGRLAAEHDNLRAALGWSLWADAEIGIRLASRLWGFWLLRGFLVEGSQWLQALLARGVSPTGHRATALLSAPALAMRMAEQERAKAWLEESRALFRTLGDAAGSARWAIDRACALPSRSWPIWQRARGGSTRPKRA